MSAISALAINAVISGSVLLGFCLVGALLPETIKTWALAFPRNIWAGRILTAVDLALVTWLLLTEGFSWVDEHRLFFLIAAPVAYIIIVIYMDELLSVRALGGLFLLLPYGILKAAFEHPAASKLLMTCFAYLLVVAGMALVWSPYLFRKYTTRAFIGAHVNPVIALTGSALGLAMIVMGLIVY